MARVSETQSLGISIVEGGLLGTVEGLSGNEHLESSPGRADKIPNPCLFSPACSPVLGTAAGLPMGVRDSVCPPWDGRGWAHRGTLSWTLTVERREELGADTPP